MRLLLVDDSEPVREVFGRMLMHLGHQVVHAADGVEALATYQANRPDGVFLDLSMPVMNGLQAAPLLRRSLQNVPIILLTLYASVLPAEIAKPAGIAAVLSKDGSLDKLIPTAKALLSQAA